MKPLLSVCLVVYNHQQFIAEALRSILMQETDFSCELIIADDCSTDGSVKMIEDFLSSTPHTFSVKRLYAKKNQGMARNFFNCISKAEGKYFALCEGDDFWIDSRKLTKQIRIMEADETIAICFHRCEERDETGMNYLDVTPAFEKSIFDIYDLAKGNFIYTLSAVYRNYKIPVPGWVFDLPAVDYPFHLLNSKKGKIYFLNEILGVYRKHQAGIWSPKSYGEKLVLTMERVLVPMINHENDERTVRLLKENLTYNFTEYCKTVTDYNKQEELTVISTLLEPYINYKLLANELLKANQELKELQKKITDSTSYKVGSKIIFFAAKLRWLLRISK